MSNYWLEGTAPKLLRKGRIGDWKNYFTPEQNKMFENEVMNKLIGTGLEFELFIVLKKILKCYLPLVVCITIEYGGNFLITSNCGNRTEWSPIWSVIIRVINKSNNHQVGVQFVNH